MQTESTAPPTTDLRSYLQVVRRRKWSILAITAIVVATALVFAFRQTKVYTSGSRVYVTPIGPGATAATLNLDTERGLADSIAVASLVQHNLQLTQAPPDLLKHLGVAVETNTDLLDISYTDPSPATAQRIAQGFAASYLQFRQDQATKLLSAQTQVFQKQIAQTQKKLSKVEQQLRVVTNPNTIDALTSQRDLLSARITALELQLGTLQASAGQGGGQIVQPAELPTSPSSPRPIRDFALALILGLGLGIGVAFLRERFDDHLRGRDDYEQTVQAPILAVVPRVGDWKNREETELVSLVAPKSVTAESYRTLRTNLQFIARDGDFRVLCVTSPSLGEGKTTTVANLGITMGQAGRKVVVVSCDLRRPRLHGFFGMPNDVGLSTVLAGQNDLASAIRRSTAKDVLVLPSGPVPPNPAELLASDAMTKILDELRRVAEFVIIDTPPVLAVSDALLLAPMSDGTLFVADSGTTTRSAIKHARQQLDQVGARVVGAVLNDYDPATAKYYGTEGYSSTYAYRYEESDTDRNGSGNGQDPASQSRRSAGFTGFEN